MSGNLHRLMVTFFGWTSCKDVSRALRPYEVQLSWQSRQKLQLVLSFGCLSCSLSDVVFHDVAQGFFCAVRISRGQHRRSPAKTLCAMRPMYLRATCIMRLRSVAKKKVNVM